jgi:hypothetical protein
VTHATRWADRLASRPPGVEPWQPRRRLEAPDALMPARALLIGNAVAAPEGVRITAVFDDPNSVAAAPEVKLTATPTDWAAWLESRRLFYELAEPQGR